MMLRIYVEEGDTIYEGIEFLMCGQKYGQESPRVRAFGV